MADYYPLLSKAVAGLDPNTQEARQAIFERARLALTRQMASMDPPVPQMIVERELGALADVMQRIEREQSAQQSSQSIGPIQQELSPPPPAPDVVAGPTQARPQVKRRDVAQKRSPLLAVGAALGFVAVAAIGTLAYLRRHEPAAVASRPAPAAVGTQQSPGTLKPEERVTPGAAETPARPTQAAQPSNPTGVAASPPRAAGPATAPSSSQAPTSTLPASPQPAQQIAIANRMVMIIQSKDDPQKVDARQGNVVWRSEMVSGGQGQTPQLAIRATVDVPDARTRTEITIQRNRDAAFPASHTVQVQFSGNGTPELGAIQALNQIEFRQVENQTGYPLAGQGIAVMENVFLVALSRTEPVQARNIEMMKTRPYIYLEFQAVGGRRGAMLLEKGVSGQQAFDDAFRNWQ
jgi:hypothetical protein